MMEAPTTNPTSPAENSDVDANNTGINASVTTATINDTDNEATATIAEKNIPKATATFTKQIGNAWGVGGIGSNPVGNAPHPAAAAAAADNNTSPDNTNNKKRSNVSVSLPSDDSTATASTSTSSELNGNGNNSSSSKLKFADIMSQQELEKSVAKPTKHSTKVSFCNEVESEEERMMRLAIEASLQDQQQHQDATQNQGFTSSDAKKMPAPALRNSIGGDVSTKSSHTHNNVSFSSNNIAYDANDDDMDDDMRMAIALSLQEAEGVGGNNNASAAVAGTYYDDDGDKCDGEGEKVECYEDDRKPSALPKKMEAIGPMDEDDSKPSAAEKESFTANESGKENNQSPPSFHSASPYSAAGTCSDSASAVASSSASACATAAATAAKPSPPDNDESKTLAQALHEAELAQYNASQSATAAAEAASLQLAMQLQDEEDARQDAEAFRLKRADMHHGGGGGSVGVRTVGMDEFNSLKSDKAYGDGRMVDRRKQEEMGMGKMLSSKNCYEDDTGNVTGGTNDAETDDYYYYSNDRSKGDDDIGEEEGDDGIRMNSQSASSSWQRLDKHSFIGPNNEIRTKHDPELKHRSNAVNLLGSHGAKIKDAYNNNGDSAGNKVSVSDRAYNAFKRAESRQSGFKKGVAKQGHGRAENMNAGKTRGGAMDGNVRLQISAAINAGLILNCNGAVKEGKEALVYHADGGWKGRQGIAESSVAPSPDESSEVVGSEGYDVAVKVFKRITEFKGRGTYVDGDPRYHKQKFKTNDQREQVVLWAEKEHRNLIRAHRAGVAVPKPLLQKENILFMRFLGEGGWPSPQLKEIDLRKGSKKWTTLYCQTLVEIRRLYHCAKLVHADLSEYNLLVCPRWQVSEGHLTTPGKSSDDDLQVVLIDFAQAVGCAHPSAAAWLLRDLSTVRDFFVKKGIKTLSNEDAEEFVVEEFEAKANDAQTSDKDEGQEDDKEPDDSKKSEATNNSDSTTWRHAKQGWDDTRDMEVLLKKMEGSAVLAEMKKAP